MHFTGIEVVPQNGGPDTPASLLSPEFRADNDTVLEVTLFTVGGARLLAIHDVYNNESLVWGRRNVFTGSPGDEVLRAALNPGLHRLRITAELAQDHVLWIDSIKLITGAINKPRKLKLNGCIL